MIITYNRGVYIRAVDPSGKYQYLQMIQNYGEGPRVRQKVIGTLGRLGRLLESEILDNLAQSLLRFSRRFKVIEAHQVRRYPG